MKKPDTDNTKDGSYIPSRMQSSKLCSLQHIHQEQIIKDERLEGRRKFHTNIKQCLVRIYFL